MSGLHHERGTADRSDGQVLDATLHHVRMWITVDVSRGRLCAFDRVRCWLNRRFSLDGMIIETVVSLDHLAVRKLLGVDIRQAPMASGVVRRLPDFTCGWRRRIFVLEGVVAIIPREVVVEKTIVISLQVLAEGSFPAEARRAT